MGDIVKHLHDWANDAAAVTDTDDLAIAAAEEIERLRDAVELAWGIIANSYGGDWKLANDEWLGAAERWRDRYVPLIHGKQESPT